MHRSRRGVRFIPCPKKSKVQTHYLSLDQHLEPSVKRDAHHFCLYIMITNLVHGQPQWIAATRPLYQVQPPEPDSSSMSD